MAEWEFREYQGADGSCPVSTWYESLSARNRAKTDRFLRIARQLKRLSMPGFRKYRELWEARWYGDARVPHRIFCYVPSGRQVVFLCGCIHKDRRYKPTNAYETSLRRRNAIQAGRATTREFDY